MKTNTQHHSFRKGMSKMEMSIVIGVIACLCLGLIVAARWWKMGSDRTAVILDIRNCQQCMRGHQGMRNQNIGEPFTRKDLEGYMKFPSNFRAWGGMIEFTPGTKHTPVGELWLQVDAPGTVDHVGRYGFESSADFDDW